MKLCFLTKLSLSCLCFALSAGQTNADDIVLPVHRFSASCDFYMSETGGPLVVENTALHDVVQNSVVNLVEFAENHQGQATYVEFSIKASNSAGWCMMFDDHLAEDLPSGKTPNDIDRQFGLHQYNVEDTDDDLFYRLWVRTSEVNSGTMSVLVPHPSSVPQDGLFITRRFGDTYYFSGPVILGFSEGNGFDAVVLHPLGNSQIFWREISEINRQ